MWVAVAGFEGRYEVSDLGRVRSLMMNGKRRELILAPRPTKRGYLRVTLGRRRDVYIHRLVAAAFIGCCPEDHAVNHKDADKTNNAASNLEYVTPKTNSQHAVAMGLMQGSRMGSSRLNEDAVGIIKAMLSDFGQYELAAIFRVTQGTISCIARGKTWKHVSPAAKQVVPLSCRSR